MYTVHTLIHRHHIDIHLHVHAHADMHTYINTDTHSYKHSRTYPKFRAKRAFSLFKDVPLRSRRALSLFRAVPLRTRRALLLHKVHSDSALLALNWQYAYACNHTRTHVHSRSIICFLSSLMCLIASQNTINLVLVGDMFTKYKTLLKRSPRVAKTMHQFINYFKSSDGRRLSSFAHKLRSRFHTLCVHVFVSVI